MVDKTKTSYIVGFAALVCGIFGSVVAVAAVQLKPLQVKNKILDQQKQVLMVAGLLPDDASKEQITQIFADNIKAEVITLKTGAPAEFDAAATALFDQQKAKKDPERSALATANSAKVKRLPDQAKVFTVMKAGEIDAIVLPIEGYGLWSTLYGYLALEADATTIKGITYYEHGETPGLGGEVDNPLWKAKWPGRKAFDPAGKVAIKVSKGDHSDLKKFPYEVDALSGATITSNGVTNMVQFWLGENGFGPYISRMKK
jgi:Na+-transporting NADH:ubiquinone oxidoreductase subunit C